MNASISPPMRSRTSPVSYALATDTTGVLLMVGPSEETSKRIESFMRNAGHPLRCGWVDDLAELEDVLNRSPPDLILCDETSVSAPPERVIQMAAELRPDLPVLIVGRSFSPEDTVAALSLGAKDLVCSEDQRHLRHLELVVIREFINHHHLRILRLTRERLEDFELRHSQLLAGTGDAVAHVEEGILSHVNPAFARLLGHDEAEELIGQPLIDFISKDQRTRVKERLRLVLKGKHNGERLEFSFNGKKGVVEVAAQLILGSDNGEPVIEMLIRATAPAAPAVEFPVGTIPANSIAVQKLQRATAGGRMGFLRAVSSPSEEVAGPRGALMLVVDSFIALEERIGMTSCEEVIEQLTDALKTRLGPADSVFLFSAGEIAAVVNRPRLIDIESLGDMLRRELGNLIFATSQHEAQVTLSVSVYPLGGDEKPETVVQDIVREARLLSQKGGNQFSVMGAAAKAGQDDRELAKKAAMVKKAIEDNRLKLAYQSIASLEGDSRQHFDVLVRLIDESGKELHAGEFLPAAEKFGLMRNIDRWVLARCLAIVAKRAGANDAPSLFVRLSEDTLKDTNTFLKWLTELLRAYPLKNQEFVFEIQEIVLQNHIRKAKILTEALHALGAGIAIDHFGVSGNCVQLLEHLPQVSFIKFHASYAQKFNDKEVLRRMTQLMEISKQKKIKSIVSHVEDANVMARLWQMGVNYIQGYHVQEPEVVLLASEIITKAQSIHAPR